MKVTLAGFNVDRDGLHVDTLEALTPETISAAYARISRSPKSIEDLRKEARTNVQQARESNSTIVFEYGHASIAEHAVFNIDISGISRLALEWLESFRLASFTEKSQRYVSMATAQWIAPLFQDAVEENDYTWLMERGLCLYNTFKDLLEKQGVDSKKAGEDARYVLPLAILGDVGMTVNARVLETMISDGQAHPLPEVNELAFQLRKVVYPAAPSLIRHTKPTPYQQNYYQRQYWVTADEDVVYDPVTVMDYSGFSADQAYEYLTFRGTDINQPPGFSSIGVRMESVERAALTYLQNISVHEHVPREWELWDITYRLELSATAYAQLKRHRMATIIPGPYNIFRYTIPQAIRDIHQENLFESYMANVMDVLGRCKTLKKNPALTCYLLPNATEREVLVKMNLRELHHFARLRLDPHAQWDIRNIATQMVREAYERYPELMRLACGKHAFDQTYEAAVSAA